MAAKDIQVCFNVHFDSVSLWLGSFGGEDSPCDISRGVHAAKVGTPRLLDIFDKYQIITTWNITGHSIESFPKQSELVAQAGHELGLHGYAHENPLAMSPQQEADVLDKCIELVVDLTGARPTGYAAPWWELSAATPNLLLERGIVYDHSMMHRDFECHRLRVGDAWTPIDYSQPASSWMKPLVRGTETPLIEIPVSWYLDDLPPMMFIKKAPNSHGFMNPRDIEELWREQFDWVYREMDEAVFTLCLHPDVAGRPQVLAMLERLLHHMLRHPGVRFGTLEAIASEYDRAHPFGG